MRKTRVGVSLLLAAVVTGSALTGCAPDDHGDKLVFRQFDPPAETEGLQRVIKTWNAEHPDNQVQLETLSGVGSGQQFAREAHTGSGPDIVQISNVEVQDLAKPSVLRPIDDLARQAPPPAPLTDYDALDMAQVDGKTWALPWTVDTFALVYRTDILQQTGTPLPKTWPELATAASRTATRTGDQQRSGFCFAAGSGATAGQWFAVNYYLWANGSTLIEHRDGQWRVGSDVRQIRAAMDYFNGLFVDGATARSMAAVNSISDPAITDGLTRGSCAMTMLAPAAYSKASADAKNLAVAPMPDGLIDGSTHLGGRMLGISANCDEPEKAWEFIRYLNSVEAFTEIDQFSASAQVRQRIGTPPGQQAYADQISHAVSFGQYTGAPIAIPTLQRLVNQEFGAVYSGQKTSQEAAEALVAGIDSRLVQQ